MQSKYRLNIYTAILLAILFATNSSALAESYKIVGTGQTNSYNNQSIISIPDVSQSFYGQNTNHPANLPSYQDNGDGTITDNVSGLMWEKTTDKNGDGIINYYDKSTYSAALAGAASCKTGGYSDWRLPTIKEMYSLMMYYGAEPSPTATTQGTAVPYINTNYFDFEFGDLNSASHGATANERLIDAQYASSTIYVSTTMNGSATMFGVNFADGRIKGYPANNVKKYYVQYVRDNSDYGKNSFVDNGDGTISDTATGLMWMQNDNGTPILWENALSYAENSTFAGYSDWKLPDVKELQSLLDYTRSPATTNSPAINPIFNCTQITNEAGETDYPYYMSSTTFCSQTLTNGTNACYVSFGRAMGYMANLGGWVDVHGAGAQRSDPKTGNPDDYPTGHGPQGDAIRIYNYVRLVRNITNSVGMLPNTPIIETLGNLEFCEGDSVVLSVLAQDDVNYQWKNSGADVGTNSPNYTAKIKGNYSVVVSNENGSVTSSNRIKVDVSYPIESPTIAVTGQTIFCEGDSVMLSVPNHTGNNYVWKNNSVVAGANSNSYIARESGNYSVEESNNCGSSLSINSIDVIVNPLPDTPEIILIGTETLECSVIGDSYQWFFNGSPLGANAREIIASESGNYTVQVSKDACLSDNSAAYNFVKTTVFDTGNDEYISISPNPATDMIHIDFQSIASQNSKISIINSLGIEIMSIDDKQLSGENSVDFSIEGLSSGMYYCVFSSQGTRISKSFAVIK